MKHKMLYKSLLAISSNVRGEKAFYYVDQQLEGMDEGHFYRIFGNCGASEKDWMIENALFCRGTMFEIKDGNMIKLASLPMRKFFNVGEIKEWEEYKISMDDIVNYIDNCEYESEIDIVDKLDGSLMTTYIDYKGDLRLKSKMSINSEHCIKAMKVLNSSEFRHLKKHLDEVVRLDNCSVDLEWTSPDNKIILDYKTDKLTILSYQDHGEKTYYGKRQNYSIWSRFDDMLMILKAYECDILLGKYLPYHYSLQEFRDFALTGRHNKGNMKEGVVINFRGKRYKIKTDEYVKIHKIKGMLSEKYIYQACLDETIDDIKSLLDDTYINQYEIPKIQDKANKDLKDLQYIVNDFYLTNKHLSTKDYAIKAKNSVKPDEFGLCMSIFNGKEVKYTDVLMKRL